MENKVIEKLFTMQDLSYKEFHLKLIPTVNPNLIIGIRTPALRKYAKELAGSKEAEQFVALLPHKYYEENNLHGFLIEKIKDYDKCIEQVKRFLPYVDNWATCDMISPKVFGKNRDKLLEEIEIWLISQHVYEVRFGIVMLMKWYLDEEYIHRSVALVQEVSSEEYYINMAKAWFFATALSVDFDKVITVIESKSLDVWTHNKAIQKAIESKRISEEQKRYLKGFKIK